MKKQLWAILFSLAPALATAGELGGKITLEASRRVGNVSVTNAVVFYRPDDPTHMTPLAEYREDGSMVEPEVTDAPIEMMMEMKAFNPLVLNVDVGTEINFPNADRVIHNAFSTTRGSEFDLGFYPQGEERSRVFDQAGLVTVFCNVHQDMVGYVMVMDTPYHTRPDADGNFTIDNIPEGTGRLFVWHPRGRTFTKLVQVESTPTELAATLRLTKRLVPNHKNKFGKPYRRSRDY